MKKVVKVFFSQPMHDLTNDEILKERGFMLSEFRDVLIRDFGYADDVVIQDVNLIFDQPDPEDAGRLWYLGRSIQSMDEADYIVFHNRWRSAKGCWVEHAAAEMYFKWRFGDTAGQDAVSEHIREVAFGKV